MFYKKIASIFLTAVFLGSALFVPLAQAKTAVKTVQTPAAYSTGYYTNIDNIKVKRPTFANTVPAGASAKCRDGSYSFSLHRRGTCSGHGGVGKWY